MCHVLVDYLLSSGEIKFGTVFCCFFSGNFCDCKVVNSLSLSRMGASDNILSGQSTFMVELQVTMTTPLTALRKWIRDVCLFVYLFGFLMWFVIGY